MFVQIIEGRTSDPAAMVAKGEEWERDLRPGAVGFLGSTAGVTADGRTINVVRFDSEEAARRNSDRPEQGAFFAEMRKLFDGEPTFTESTDVTQLLGGGSNDAGFVQIMKSTGVDRGQVEAFDELMERYADFRPDVIGGHRIWTGPDSCVEVVYFTSEEEARRGEQVEPPAEIQAELAKFMESMGSIEYLDLTEPRLV